MSKTVDHEEMIEAIHDGGGFVTREFLLRTFPPPAKHLSRRPSPLHAQLAHLQKVQDDLQQ